MVQKKKKEKKQAAHHQIASCSQESHSFTPPPGTGFTFSRLFFLLCFFILIFLKVNKTGACRSTTAAVAPPSSTCRGRMFERTRCRDPPAPEDHLQVAFRAVAKLSWGGGKKTTKEQHRLCLCVCVRACVWVRGFCGFEHPLVYTQVAHSAECGELTGSDATRLRRWVDVE